MSTSHDRSQERTRDVSDLLAAAVEAVLPEAVARNRGVGDDNSYADFDISPPISARDLPGVERELKRLIAATGEGDPAAVRIGTVSGVYPDGDESKPMRSRVTAVAFPRREELAAYLEEAERRRALDHRTIGAALGLFTVDETVGKGFPLLKPKGATMRRVLERYIVDEELRRGYEHVNTPVMGRRELYEISGHLDHYHETMFPPITLDNEELYLRPMTCPHHFMLYKSELRSYRDLPIRYAEISPLFRKELSGSLYGLVRILQFHLADAHVFCPFEQIHSEFVQAIELIRKVMGDLGLADRVSFRLSLRDESKEKYIADDAGWELAEATLRGIVDDIGLDYEVSRGDASHYGPKLDIEIENANGKQETIFTNQLDFALAKRFGLEYVDADGGRKHPYIIHRSSVGCIERTIAFLTEHYEGAFPLWLAPIQIVVLPVTRDATGYAWEVREALGAHELRATVDGRDTKLGGRIHEARKQLVPYLCVVGEREASERSVSVKNRDSEGQTVRPLEEFARAAAEETRRRSLVLEL